MQPNDEMPNSQQAPKSRIHQLPKLLRVALATICLAMLTKAVEFMGSDDFIAQAVSYQQQAMNGLSATTPITSTLLFLDSMGYDVDDAMQSTPLYRSSEAVCASAAGQAIAEELSAHPELGQLGVSEDGMAYCVPLIDNKQDSEVSVGEAPKCQSKVTIGTKEYCVGKAVEAQSNSSAEQPISTDGLENCESVEAVGISARQACMTSQVGKVGNWGEFVARSDDDTGFMSKIARKAAAPVAGLADVLWNNYLSWSPGSLLRLTLMALGGLATLRLFRGLFETVDYSLPVLCFVLPLGAIAISTVLASIFYYVALAALLIFGNALKLAAVPVAGAGIYGTVLVMAKQFVLDEAVATVSRKIKKVLGVEDKGKT